MIAHRGSRILWPENTMVAFGNALRSGADHLETDLQITADGHLVCFHDQTVDRTTDGAGRVSSFTLSELRKLDAGHRHRLDGEFPFRGRGIRVPTLGEVLATFSDVGVVVDLKDDGMEGRLVELLDRMNAWDRAIVGSFSDARLATFDRLAQGRGLRSGGPNTIRAWWAATRLGQPGPTGFAAIQIPPTYFGIRLADRRMIDTAHAAGLAVHVWTINHPNDIAELRRLGVDAIITDRVDLAVR